MIKLDCGNLLDGYHTGSKYCFLVVVNEEFILILSYEIYNLLINKSALPRPPFSCNISLVN